MSATERSPQALPRVVTVEELFHEYSGPVYRYCLARLGSPEEAEDAVQVTYLNAWRGLRQGTQPDEPRAWLFTIAANVASTFLRSRLRGGKVEIRAPEDFERLPSGEVREDELVGLEAALMELPVRQRQALLLRDWRGLSYAEIANELDASEPAVETLLFRARRAVAVSLAKPARRIRRAPLRSALSALGPWPSALSGAKSWLTGGATAKALAIAIGATAPLAAFGVAERTLFDQESSGVAATQALQAETAIEQSRETASPLPASPQLGRRVAASREERSTTKARTKPTAATAATGPGGAAPPQPDASTTPSPPGSVATNDPPADEVAGPEVREGLVTLCHLTGSKKHPTETISVANAAVEAHLALGDVLGPCAS
jgi:RNA polymerase sigma factor (sigma-70 family)